MSTFNLREWILTQTNPDYVMKIINDTEIHLDTTYGHGVIRNWPDEIYEFQIINKKDETTGFYLHFQANDHEHAKELFGEFIEALLKLKQKQKTKVLLCCSSGITTMFFCEKLNEYAQLTGCDYEFNAVNFTRVYELGFDYDIIAIAPQVGYLEKKIKEVLTKKVVVKIPTKIFGSYDTRGAMKFFDSLSPKKLDKEEEVLEITKKVDTDRTLLVIGVLREIGNVRIVYRVYDKGVAHEEKLIIKEELKLSDIEDIIDLVMATEKGITGVCVSLPGIVTHGVVNLQRVDFDGKDIRRILTDKYHIPFVICNNANAIALGIYSSQDKHHSIIYHS
ncbi:MAG: hypothetical protein HUJ56_06450, partial [Erysipelotrichaceae bacterium]|nr:hypothetical protein [Erysipelotrichaceae bacterium]